MRYETGYVIEKSNSIRFKQNESEIRVAPEAWKLECWEAWLIDGYKVWKPGSFKNQTNLSLPAFQPSSFAASQPQLTKPLTPDWF
jgi:hypothetical protein